MSKLTIIGGHGKVALLLEPMLIAAGHEVDAVIRDAHQAAEVEATGANPVVQDVERLSTDNLAELLRDSDAVIWAAGAGWGDPARTYAVDRDAAIRTVDAAAASGTKRFIMVSYLGAGPDHGVPADDPFFPYAEAKAAADAHLRDSGLDWTIVAPGALTLDPPTGRIETDPSGRGSVPRADVAAVIEAALADPTSVHRTIAFVSGHTRITDAVGHSA
ncbi:NAD dependent epimerase/dehydratase family protein [Acidipropionibacterium acidipropionici ATCC 4875]|uniref:NAD dependent epimerase/dehydratase family protein n=1 Tax=Acidipropionibacterium acidipropionici (strain ATCC 4875 / DSM 20272 / JCM 6432 / NBRC 12425 / NCIMB 8070 / 4) TaxID=1171373 RepID=K7S796_ACIA4|nr:SDR family oxidoreductase [Acidipropionibacterium acidipropionici]AFV90467.1 NAD dependent epimerase/dehydratase family protein [Acidipropionibacterium acidipropionici ATCC 4875]